MSKLFQTSKTEVTQLGSPLGSIPTLLNEFPVTDIANTTYNIYEVVPSSDGEVNHYITGNLPDSIFNICWKPTSPYCRSS
jgi:hypothetical protein